jgi:peptide/nickel transport system permease protein
MVAYIIRRFIQAVFVIVIISIIVFLAVRLLPGDPVLMYLDPSEITALSQEQIDAVRSEFGLDKPWIVQYFNWAYGVFRGDLGTSLFYHENVIELVLRRLPVTLHIGLISFVLGSIIGLVAGILSAIRRGKTMDLFVTLMANIGITMPIFWLAILLVYLFGLTLGWLPTHGYVSPFEDVGMNTKQIIMPIACLSIFTIGAMARQARSCVLEVVQQDYVRTAWSKGLDERTIIFKHVLKNSLIPVVTLSGMQISQILGGSVLIETVFNIAGMGRLAVDAVFSLDYSVIQALTLIMSIMVVVANLAVDISYGWLDPRIRYI